MEMPSFAGFALNNASFLLFQRRRQAIQPGPLGDPIDRTRRGRQVFEWGQELANLIAVDALLPVQEHLLLNIPSFFTRACSAPLWRNR